MIIKKHKDSFIIPEHSSIEIIVLRDFNDYPLCQFNDVQKLRNEKPAPFGRPVYFSSNGNVLSVYPTPDKDYEIKVVYAPPLMEI